MNNPYKLSVDSKIESFLQRARKLDEKDTNAILTVKDFKKELAASAKSSASELVCLNAYRTLLVENQALRKKNVNVKTLNVLKRVLRGMISIFESLKRCEKEEILVFNMQSALMVTFNLDEIFETIERSKL